MLINKKLKILLSMILCSIVVESQGNIILNDGQYHIIDYHETIPINVKLNTVLEIIPGGKCRVGVGDTGKVIINGGVLTSLGVSDDAYVTFLNGTLNNYCYSGGGNSHLEMSGGIIHSYFDSRGIRLRDYSTAKVSGGMLEGDFMLWDSSGLTFVGSDFTIDGVSVGLYEDIRNYATYEHISDGIYGYTGTITGILADGSELNNYFEIWDDDGESLANMYLVPEPCGVLLFGVGGMVVMWRRSGRREVR